MTAPRTRIVGRPQSRIQIGEWIDMAARRTPRQACFVSPSGTRSFAEVRDRVHRLARGLQRMGLRQGDRVAVRGAYAPVVRHALGGPGAPPQQHLLPARVPAGDPAGQVGPLGAVGVRTAVALLPLVVDDDRAGDEAAFLEMGEVGVVFGPGGQRGYRPAGVAGAGRLGAPAAEHRLGPPGRPLGRRLGGRGPAAALQPGPVGAQPGVRVLVAG